MANESGLSGFDASSTGFLPQASRNFCNARMVLIGASGGRFAGSFATQFCISLTSFRSGSLAFGSSVPHITSASSSSICSSAEAFSSDSARFLLAATASSCNLRSTTLGFCPSRTSMNRIGMGVRELLTASLSRSVHLRTRRARSNPVEPLSCLRQVDSPRTATTAPATPQPARTMSLAILIHCWASEASICVEPLVVE